jgi:hypothetical protein
MRPGSGASPYDVTYLPTGLCAVPRWRPRGAGLSGFEGRPWLYTRRGAMQAMNDRLFTGAPGVPRQAVPRRKTAGRRRLLTGADRRRSWRRRQPDLGAVAVL